MDYSHWFYNQLQASAEGFVWGAELVPVARRFITPPPGLGEWTAARHVFHMLYYERTIALPSMHQWLGAPRPATEDLDEDVEWQQVADDFSALLAGFKQVRDEQIALLSRYNQDTWATPQKTVWGQVTLLWVVSKTFQHTAEHTHDVMRLALFWDAFARG